MAVVTLSSDLNDDGLFKSRKLLPPGIYTFEVANDLKVEASKSSQNRLIKVELKCTDDGEYFGQTVYDVCVLTKKAEFKIVHLALSAGQTREMIREQGGPDLGAIKGAIVQARVAVEPETKAPDGTTYRAKNRVEQYMFEEVQAGNTSEPSV